MMALPWSSEVDVVIVGAGGAGLQAAIEAALGGGSVLVFEKQARLLESSTAISVGRIKSGRVADNSMYWPIRTQGSPQARVSKLLP